MRAHCFQRFFVWMMLALASGARATVLVYEGFDATDYSLATDSCEAISGRSLENQTAAIGTSTANWGGDGRFAD